jgi:hypothetical protein
MRYALAFWLTSISCLAESQTVTALKNGVILTGSGSASVSGLFNGDVELNYVVGAITGGGSIVFTISAVDPLSPATGALASASSPSISSATGPGVVVLHAGHSSSVTASWTVSGTFSSTIYLSVQGITPSEIQGVDGGFPVTIVGGTSSPGVYVTGGDGGLPVTTIVADFPGFICCGTSFTAIPYNGTCLSGQNFGPNAVIVVADGGTVNEGKMLVGTSQPTVSPGGDFSVCSVGVPYGCIAEVASQTDGGCMATSITH